MGEGPLTGHGAPPGRQPIERARGGRSDATRAENVIRPSRFKRDGDDQPPLH